MSVLCAAFVLTFLNVYVFECQLRAHLQEILFSPSVFSVSFLEALALHRLLWGHQSSVNADRCTCNHLPCLLTKLLLSPHYASFYLVFKIVFAISLLCSDHHISLFTSCKALPTHLLLLHQSCFHTVHRPCFSPPRKYAQYLKSLLSTSSNFVVN